MQEQFDKQAGFIGARSEKERPGDERLSADGSERDVHVETVGDNKVEDPLISVTDCNVYYGDTHAIKSVSLDVGRNEVISLIGPSGCGKSTFLRCLNRMNDTIDIARVEGEILLDSEDKRPDCAALGLVLVASKSY